MTAKKVWLLVIVLLVSVPLGLLTDAEAWGEWDVDYYAKKLGFIPEGMKQFSLSLHPLLPDYSAPGTGSVTGYYISAAVGVVLIYFFWMLIGKILAKK
ncbi:PDGLE domain-containing protein [Nitratifractor sp.]|uniref:PDGLE domain-containing protein n=1 Tax=Nitratifractor sp. TaxID=2268144 RepID=UPI0025FB4970|nr:PDGLE domain-containing protein [Nitratifractor sp.]